MTENAISPEENFNNDLAYVLKKIKEKSLYTKYGEDIRYEIVHGFFGKPYNDDEVAIVRKLDEWKIITLLKSDPESGYVDAMESDRENNFFHSKNISPIWETL